MLFCIAIWLRGQDLTKNVLGWKSVWSFDPTFVGREQHPSAPKHSHLASISGAKLLRSTKNFDANP